MRQRKLPRTHGERFHRFVGAAGHMAMWLPLLHGFDREIQSLEGSINEAEEDLENTR
jgi:hypothetical protein